MTGWCDVSYRYVPRETYWLEDVFGLLWGPMGIALVILALLLGLVSIGLGGAREEKRLQRLGAGLLGIAAGILVLRLLIGSVYFCESEKVLRGMHYGTEAIVRILVGSVVLGVPCAVIGTALSRLFKYLVPGGLMTGVYESAVGKVSVRIVPCALMTICLIAFSLNALAAAILAATLGGLLALMPAGQTANGLSFSRLIAGSYGIALACVVILAGLAAV